MQSLANIKKLQGANNGKLQKCYLNRLDDLKQVSRHVVISISGFTSSHDDSQVSWTGLKNLLEPQGVSAFDYKWESDSANSILAGILDSSSKVKAKPKSAW